jgi:hypothetical protein
MSLDVSDYSPEELLSRPLVVVAAILRQTRERRSGLDRRLGSDRRELAPGNPKEQVNLRLFGERRSGVRERRSGIERRGFAARSLKRRRTFPSADAREAWASPDPRRFGVRTRAARRPPLL